MTDRPTDYEDCCRRSDWEHVRNFVRHNCVEEVEEGYEAEADVKGSENEENWVNPWKPLVCNFGEYSVKDIGGMREKESFQTPRLDIRQNVKFIKID